MRYSSSDIREKEREEGERERGGREREEGGSEGERRREREITHRSKSSSWTDHVWPLVIVQLVCLLSWSLREARRDKGKKGGREG